MRIFVAGATGVLGRAIIPRLLAQGHEVVGMTRTPAKQDLLRSLGARPIVADALDAGAVAEAVAAAQPEVIVHELTALSVPVGMRDARRPDRSEAVLMTNRLRIDATNHLVCAGQAVAARRFVAQSFAAYRWAPTCGPVVTEADPMDLDSPVQPPSALAALAHLERTVTSIGWGVGVVLRYGGLYGAGTAISRASDAQLAGPVRQRRFPIIGRGAGSFSHVSVNDAAAATVAAVERGDAGVYNVVDDEPAAVREWLPVLAGALGARPPRHIPRWLGLLAAGHAVTTMMTDVNVRGASNEKAKRELGWQLEYPSWRQGFVAELADAHGAR